MHDESYPEGRAPSLFRNDLPPVAVAQVLHRHLFDSDELQAFRPWMHGLITLFAACSIVGFLFLLYGQVFLVSPLVGAVWLLLTLLSFRLVQWSSDIRQEYSRTLLFCALSPLGWVALVSDPLGSLIAFTNLIFITCAALTLTVGAGLRLLLITFGGLAVVRLGQNAVAIDAGLAPMPQSLIQGGQMAAIYIIHFLSITYIVTLLWRQKERNRTARRELETAHARLKDSERARSVFLSTITHELRTPLTSIHGFVDLMLRAESPHAGELSIVKRAATRLEKLINEFLDVAEAPSLTKDMQIEVVDLGEVVKEEIALLKERAKKAGITLHHTGTPGCRMHGDRLRLSQVVSNLVVNALDHSPEETRVTVSLQHDGHRLSLTVADQGPGISPENLPHIFAPFFTQPSLVKKRKGVGLGLTICKQIVEATNGCIMVEGETAHGTTFSVQFPRVADVPVEKSPEKGTLRALILDDDRDILLLMETHLTSLGFEVQPAATGTEALEAAKRKDFDLVVLDVNVPGLSGIEVSRRLQERKSGAKIFLFSAMLEQELEACVAEAKADGFIRKPCHFPDLTEQLRAAGFALRTTPAGR